MDVPSNIAESLRHWLKMARRLERIFIVLCGVAVTSSILVAAFTQELGYLGTRCMATAAALSIGYLSFFNMQKRIAGIWRGWRHLNSALALYAQGRIGADQLEEEFAHAEHLTGLIEWNPVAATIGTTAEARDGDQWQTPLNQPVERQHPTSDIADDNNNSMLSRIDIMQLESWLIYH